MINLELLNESESISLKLKDNTTGGTSDYNDLSNKPTINGRELKGNLTTDDLGIESVDVQVNGVSIVNDGVADIPIMTHEKVGVAKYWNAYGIQANDDGYLQTLKADNNNIDKRDSNYRAIVSSNLDYAVKQAMTDGKGAQWTSEEKASARERIGLEWKLLGDVTVEEDGVTKIEIPIDNPNYNEYQFYVYVADRKTPTAQNMNIGFDGVTSTSYVLTYAGVGTNTNYFLRAHTWRNCNNGWLTLAMGSKDGKPCSQSHIRGVDYYYKDSTNPLVVANTEKPYKISVSLSTGLDIGSKFIVYAR